MENIIVLSELMTSGLLGIIIFLYQRVRGEMMAQYVDGFIIPIKKKNLKAYKKMATLGCKVWMEHGALDYYECVGDSLDTPFGVSFKKLCKLKPDETVIFAFIIYKSKAHAARVNKKVQSDPRMNPENFTSIPFDMKRFTVGKFAALVRAKA